MNRVPAIILAAGESRRMGSPKALLDFRGETFLDGLIGRLEIHCDPVIVVLGHDAARIRSRLGRTAHIVENPDYRLGMLTSLQRGLRELPAGASHVVFSLVDHPNPAVGTVRSVVDAAEGDVVIPRYGGKKGHPVRLSRAVAEELLALPRDAKPTDVLYRRLATTTFLDTDDPGVVDDIDDPQAYDELLARTGQDRARI